MPDINVIVRFGTEEAAYEASATETVGTVKARALRLLKLAETPGTTYGLAYKGRELADEHEPLSTLLQESPQERIELQLAKRPTKFTVTVIATSAKELAAEPHELIEALKRAALRAFGIPEGQAPDYRLAMSPGNPSSELPNDKTLADCGLQNGSKVYLIKPHTDA